jgi:hypothetical protein
MVFVGANFGVAMNPAQVAVRTTPSLSPALFQCQSLFLGEGGVREFVD